MLIYDLSYNQLETFLIENNYEKYRAMQIWKWIYQKKINSFNEMKNIPANLIEILNNSFSFNALNLVLENKSNDKTIKFLYELSDGNLIETVLMNHNYGKSVCVTTQIGCNIGCSFCASGLLKKKRNLTTGEIIAQIIESERISGEKITHIVVMGIGEPFDNYDNLIKFLTIVNDANGMQIGARHITVSTSGIINKIIDYADFNLQVNLAISLHAPNNEIRSKLMKINKAYPIEKLIDAIKYYIEKTKRRVTIEYILIDGINDGLKEAIGLVNLLRGMNVYVNLIPYNEVKESGYKRSSLKNQLFFHSTLIKNGITAILRKEQGHDINAACGQLRSKHL